MAKQTPAQYASGKIKAGAFPSMTIISICGGYFLGNDDFDMLNGKTYKSQEAAAKDRSKIIGRAMKRAL